MDVIGASSSEKTDSNFSRSPEIKEQSSPIINSPDLREKIEEDKKEKKAKKGKARQQESFKTEYFSDISEKEDEENETPSKSLRHNSGKDMGNFWKEGNKVTTPTPSQFKEINGKIEMLESSPSVEVEAVKSPDSQGRTMKRSTGEE